MTPAKITAHKRWRKFLLQNSPDDTTKTMNSMTITSAPAEARPACRKSLRQE
jgi:hypothetical protein